MSSEDFGSESNFSEFDRKDTESEVESEAESKKRKAKGTMLCDDEVKEVVMVNGKQICKCKERFFENSKGKCIPCHRSCLTCKGGNKYECIICSPGSYRHSTLNTCEIFEINQLIA